MRIISPTAIIYPNVDLGDDLIIEDYCIIGLPCDNGLEGINNTIIGNGAHIRAGSYVYSGVLIGQNFHSGNRANIREFCTIGSNVSIGTNSVIEHHVIIGDNVRIHSQAFIPEFSELRDGSWVGPNVVMTNAVYPKHPNAKNSLKGPLLMENSKIGANVTLLPGITVGRGSLVGAGSLVSSDVPDNVLAYGFPAKTIRNIDY